MLIRRARALAALSRSELVTLVGAALALRVAPMLLRRMGLQGLQTALIRRAAPRPAAVDEVALATVSRLVAVAARIGPAKPNCLARSVVLWWLLARRGVDSEVRIGVRRSRNRDGMDFHAWVERRGVVLNDAPDIRQQFATFDRAIVPRPAAFD